MLRPDWSGNTASKWPSGDRGPAIRGGGALKFRSQCPLQVVVLPFLLAVSAMAQAQPQGTTKAAVEQKGFTWTETYEGSGNTDGFITDLNSTVGYIFRPGQHKLLIGAGSGSRPRL